MILLKEENQRYRMSSIDQDGLWKKVIEDLFEEFLLFVLPTLHAHVDFKMKPEFLDKELFQEVGDDKKGRRFADQLVKVRLNNGEEKWVLIHVEIQSVKEADFSERMFQYFYRIYDRYEEKVIAVAVDSGMNDRNNYHQFEYEYFGTKLNYSYNNIRLEDFSSKLLEQSEYLFSKIILTAKALHETKDKDYQRYLFKRKLMREILWNKKHSKTEVQATLHFVDYLLRLPEQYLKKLSEEIRPLIRKESKLMGLYNEENASPTVLYSFQDELERGEKRGLEQGLRQGDKLRQRETAKKMLLKGMSQELVVEITELAIDEVEEIQKELEE